MKKQTITEHKGWSINCTVSCVKCGKTIGLSDGTLNGATGLAWFDPYNKKMYYAKGYPGAFAHFNCLSEKRKEELIFDDTDRTG